MNENEKIKEDLQYADLVMGDVELELFRQREKWGFQDHSDHRWLPILVEEIGEVAESLQVDTDAFKSTDASNLYTELVQVAAVSVSWAARLKARSPGGERG